MDTKTIIYVVIAIFGTVLGLYLFVFRYYVSNKTCEANRNCIEAEIKGLQKWLDDKFEHLEEVIKNARPR